MNLLTLEQIQQSIFEENKDSIKKVLIVDPNNSTRNESAEFLEQSGFSTATADCGFKALEVLTFFHADIVILDCDLNNLESLKCSQYIQQIDPEISIIFTSEDSCSELKILAFKAGGKELLEKPYNYTELTKVIEKYSQ